MVCCRGGIVSRPKSLVDHRSLTGGLITRPYTHVSYISKIILHFHKTAPGHVPGDNGVTGSWSIVQLLLGTARYDGAVVIRHQWVGSPIQNSCVNHNCQLSTVNCQLSIIPSLWRWRTGDAPGGNGVTDSLEVIVTPPGCRPVRYYLAHPTTLGRYPDTMARQLSNKRNRRGGS